MLDPQKGLFLGEHDTAPNGVFDFRGAWLFRDTKLLHPMTNLYRKRQPITRWVFLKDKSLNLLVLSRK